MTLPDPGEPDTPVPPQPVSGAVAPDRRPAPIPAQEQDDTPAYGIPVPPADGPWPAVPAPHPAETVQLRTIPQAGGTTGGGGGGGGGPEKRTGPASRKPLALLLGAAAVVALSGTAVAVWALPSSDASDAALVEAKAAAPSVSAPPAAPSASPSPSTSSASPSGSPSPSASKSASPSPSPSPSASRSSAPPSPSPTPSASRPASSPPAQAPILRFGDTGPEVEKLQRLLAARGLYRGKINGRFDWRVEDALSEFQYDKGIDDQEWGFYGPVTRKALEG
ncbi:peptidoglycan-binding domain-containing protein [Streptomyces sp. WM6368]|uniref:peptidoglycan-binding domain-containing protein n=1 Tax=Streptomyces sp. WM6368 TaxID=1415554 RepID=UPI00131DCB97|nr:peptidoglycan-binding domain-containing protein [Streptomyces sp. WM6368]